MSKQQTNKEQVAEAERVIAELERKRAAVAERKAELNATRERLSFAAHAGLDAQASRELTAARAQALTLALFCGSPAGEKETPVRRLLPGLVSDKLLSRLSSSRATVF